MARRTRRSRSGFAIGPPSRHVVDRVDVAREEGCDARAGIGERSQDDLVPCRPAAPVPGIGGQAHMAARHPLDEAIGTGADGVLAGVEGRRLGALPDAVAHDRDRREAVRQRRQRQLRAHEEAMVVERLDRGDVLEMAAIARRRVRDVGSAAQRMDGVARGERGAIVEPHAAAELHLPGKRIGRRAPGRREAGAKLHRGPDIDERIEHVLPDDDVGPDLREMGVDRRRVGGDADAQHLRRRRGLQRDDGKKRGGEPCERLHIHPPGRCFALEWRWRRGLAMRGTQRGGLAMGAAARSEIDIDLDLPGKRLGTIGLVHSDDRHAFSRIPVPIAAIVGGDGPGVMLSAGTHSTKR